MKIPAVLGTGKVSQRLRGFRHACFGMPALTLRAERKGCWDVPGSSSPGDREHKRARLLAGLEGESCFRIAGIFDTVAALSFLQLMRSGVQWRGFCVSLQRGTLVPPPGACGLNFKTFHVGLQC